MKRQGQTILIIIFATLFGIPLTQAQDLSIKSYVNRSRIALDRQFELTVELSGSDAQQAGDPALPDIEEFAAYVGSSSSQSIQIINGQMSVTRGITYTFVATKEGKFQIPPVSLEYKGKSYRTDPISIEITKAQTGPAQTRPQGGGQPNEPLDLEDQLFLQASVNKARVYQNEPVILTYKIYTAVSVTSYGISQLPNTVGFWSEEFPSPQRPELSDEVVNGRRFRVAEIKRMALFPQGPGVKELDPMVINCEVQLPRSRRNRRDLFDRFFDDPFFSNRTQRQTIRSNRLKIEVMPLPEKGKPADFSGSVGEYAIVASIDKNAVKTNEALTLEVSISGTGNINILPEPSVAIPTDFEAYDPKVSTNINRNGAQIRGSKTFEYVLIPRFPGNQTIRPISFSYFDLKSKDYRTVSTDPIELAVAKGDKPLVAAPIGSSKEDVKFIGQDIRFIQTQMPEFRRIGPPFYKKVPFYLVLALPLIALGSVLAYRGHLDKLSSNVAYARSKKANQMALKRLRKASQKMQNGNSQEFYSEIAMALMGFIGDKFNVPAAGLITDEVDTMLHKRGIDKAIVEDYLDCLKACDFKRFAAADSDNGEMKQFFDSAKKAIISMERAL
ncbi:BatD family protein [bacterium]|nr:BatD family protein [bacterium]